MGLITSALTSGRNALLTYQASLEVLGNNVSNAGNADYARQSAHLAAVQGVNLGPGMESGLGVTMYALERHVDEALENRLRLANGDVESSSAQSELLSRVEGLLGDVDGEGISQKITEFFNALSDVQNAPDDVATRSVTISTAESLADSLRSLRIDMNNLGLEANDEVTELVAEGNRLSQEIADLNHEISNIEASGTGQANSLRDRRDGLLRDLGQLFDVTVREQPDGSINVYIGSDPLVQNGLSRGLTTVDEIDGEFVRTSVRFADTNSQVDIGGGRIEGLIEARDEHVYAQISSLDEFAAGLIKEINAIHADGQGLEAFTSVTAQNAVDDTTAALDSLEAGLALPPVNGSFYITVTDDATGTPVAHRIEINLDGTDAGTSLDDLVTAINDEVDGVTAAIAADNRLTLTADTGLSFTFGHDGAQLREDNAKLLTALGINTFFEGSTAADIKVRDYLIDDPAALAAATVSRVGDGENAGRMAGALNDSAESLGGSSIIDYYNLIHNRVAANGAVAKNNAEAASVVAESLLLERESISGVSLDEEAIDMLKYERAFQGAARYVSTVDDMMQEMLALVT